MITKHQFETVSQLIDSGVADYIQIRMKAGLTSDELDDILENVEYYNKKFAEEDRLKKEAELKGQKKKPWWKR